MNGWQSKEEQAAATRAGDCCAPQPSILIDSDVCSEAVTRVPVDVARVSLWRLHLRFASGLDISLLTIGVLCTVGVASATPLGTFFVVSLIAQVGAAGKANVKEIMDTISLNLIILGSCAAVCMSISAMVIDGLMHKHMAQYKISCIRAILRQDIGWYDMNKPEQLTSRISNDFLKLAEGLDSKSSARAIEITGACLGCFIISGVFAWDVFLVTISLSPAYVVAGWFMDYAQITCGSQKREAYGEAGGICMESLSAMRTVASLTSEILIADSYDKFLVKARIAQLREAVFSGLAYAVLTSLDNIMVGVGLLYAGIILGNERRNSDLSYTVSVSNESNAFPPGDWNYCALDCGDPYDIMNLATSPSQLACSQQGLKNIKLTCATSEFFFMAYNVYQPTLSSYEQHINDNFGSYFPCKRSQFAALIAILACNIGAGSIGTVGISLTRMSNGKQAGRSLLELIKTVPKIDSLSLLGEQLTHVTGRIEVRNVVFAYPSQPEQFVANGYSLLVPSGQVVALCGASGSGKSTCIALVERFYDPLRGTVVLDGIDIKKLNLSWLRQQISLVAQEPVLFLGTVRHNILNGKKNASESEVEEACVKANAHQFIVTNLVNGYDTEVGEGGGQLSGGQKQRLAIARALVRQPVVLLLDEATSALDVDSERVVEAALQKCTAGNGMTTITVAHRLSTIRHADKIAVVLKGAVVEEGTYDGLCARGGHFFELVCNARHTEAPSEHKLLAKKPSGGALASSVPTSSVPTYSVPTKLRRGSLFSVPTFSAPTEPCASSVPTSSMPTGNIGQQEHSFQMDESVSILGSPVHTSATFDFVSNQTQVLPEKILTSLFRYYRKNDPVLLVVGALLSILDGAFLPVTGYIFTKASASLSFSNPDEISSATSMWALLYLGLGASHIAVATLESWCFGLTGAHLTQSLRQLSFRALMRQEMGFFDQKQHSPGELCNFLSVKIELVQAMSVEKIGGAGKSVSTIGTGFCLMFIFGYWQLCLITLSAGPILASASTIEFRASSHSKVGGESSEQKDARLLIRLVSMIVTGARTVAGLNLQQDFCKEYNRLVLDQTRRSYRQTIVAALPAGFARGFPFVVMGASNFYAAILIDEEMRKINLQQNEDDCVSADMSFVEKSFVPIMVLLYMAMSLGLIASTSADASATKDACKDLFKIMHRQSRIDSSPDRAGLTQNIVGRIAADDIYFAYPTNPDFFVCQGYSVTIEPHQWLGICGPSGSGKSTLIALIERFYDPQSGTLFIDGVDIKSLNLMRLRQRISLVGQEPVLFKGTVRENIQRGKFNATNVEVKEAVIAANALEFISQLPHGFDSDVGYRGARLSGGQKQRIAIARAVVREPAIFLLDEATSALDSVSERLVQEGLDRARESMRSTTLTIAHRLTTIRGADKLIVIDQGKVVEEGTHYELLNMAGIYKNLVVAQEL